MCFSFNSHALRNNQLVSDLSGSEGVLVYYSKSSHYGKYYVKFDSKEAYDVHLQGTIERFKELYIGNKKFDQDAMERYLINLEDVEYGEYVSTLEDILSLPISQNFNCHGSGCVGYSYKVETTKIPDYKVLDFVRSLSDQIANRPTWGDKIMNLLSL